MIDEIYKNSFKEVYDILENTEEDLLSKIPNSFMNFIKNNMNVDYKTSINLNETIDKQHLLKETEAILSLIYRSYWATDEEKNEFAKKDNLELIKEEEQKKEQYQGKDIYKVFEERKNLNTITVDNNLMVIENESFIKRIFRKFLNIFKKQYTEVNVELLNRFENGTEVTAELLKSTGAISKIEKDGVKILGEGTLEKAVTVKAAKFTASAQEKIEKAGLV